MGGLRERLVRRRRPFRRMQFTAAVAGTAKKFVVISGAITETADQVKIRSNTSLIGKNSGAKHTGFGVIVQSATTVIIRNIAISKVLADAGLSTNVWLDHVDVSLTWTTIKTTTTAY
ncbi:putative pectate lyase A [Lachnellula arida]|uniref:Putative pectate lyase A n=1 Tax=Lachnellula arida TaxID=1316785 RepID=A0A8T9BGF1_9HELO|nr:putative pectate lyase A [Lachnellula arida]